MIARFEPLGDVPVPDDNPLTEKSIELGKTLFFDPRLSENNKISCASCHTPALGWSDGLPVFKGFDGFEGDRRTLSIINSAYYDELFWDGRAKSLEEQAYGPICSAMEMNMNLNDLVRKLKRIDGYEELFQNAYDDGLTLENISKALGSFQRTIILDDTPFEQFIAGDYDALTEEEILGMDLFTNKARCITCHNGPHLSDNNYHNIGIESNDMGRKKLTRLNAHDGAFRTPGLYGIAHHPPYMHNGSLETLEKVVEYYNRGGDNHPNKSAMIKELNLTKKEKKALIAFLQALSGDKIPIIEPPPLPDENK